MKRAGSIFFVALFLSAYTAFGQFLLLPTLIHHYLEHVQWEDVTFVQFVADHYVDDINHPDDQHHDHQHLPFKSSGALQANGISALIPVSLELSLSVYSRVEDSAVPQYSSLHSTSYLSSIWHPPCFC